MEDNKELTDSEKLLTIGKIMSFIFTEDRIDCNTKLNHIIIHFPHIVITTSNQEKHNIFDMYIKLQFDSKAKFLYLGGTRTTFTKVEIINNYAHSHLSSSGINNFSSMCFGQGPMRTLDIEMRDCNKLWENGDLIIRYCKTLDHYLKVESTVTGPYKYISSLKKNNNNSYTYKMILHFSKIITNSLLQNKINFNNIIYTKQNNVAINMSPLNFCKNVLLDHDNTDTYILKNEKLFFMNKSSSNYKFNYIYPFLFKNKEINRKIINIDTEEKIEEIKLPSYELITKYYNIATLLLNINSLKNLTNEKIRIF